MDTGRVAERLSEAVQSLRCWGGRGLCLDILLTKPPVKLLGRPDQRLQDLFGLNTEDAMEYHG
jgi:hypothetical protein